MSDLGNVMREAEAAYGVREISDGCARTIASLFHGGQASVSYSFVSTGAIPTPFDDLIRDLWPTSPSDPGEKLMLSMLGTYCANRADRGPVEGWSRLWVAATRPDSAGKISVCQCCMLSHANGECCAEDHDREPLSAIPDGYSVTMGLLTEEHADGCTEADRSNGDCTCEQLGFSMSSCDGCGSPLGGDRFALTLWRD